MGWAIEVVLEIVEVLKNALGTCVIAASDANGPLITGEG